MRRSLLLVALLLASTACGSGNTPALENRDIPAVGEDPAPEATPAGDLPGPRDAGPGDDGPADPGTRQDAPPPGDLPQIPDLTESGPADLAPPDDTKPLDPGLPADPGSPDTSPADPGSPPETADPGLPGPLSTTTTKADVRRGNRTIPVVAHVPAGTGPWPLVVFLPGFQASTDLYQGTVDRLATHGFLVIRATPPGSLFNVSHVEMRDDARAVIDWALDDQGPLGGKADPSRIGIMGHSLGGKISVMTAFSDARVRAVFAMDPVNGGNPITGYSASLPDIVPDQVAPLAIPLGLPGEDWSATHAAALSPSCAPADQNYRTFYDAAASAPWKALWSLGGADHQDFVDDPEACGFTCSVCPDGPGDDAAQVAAARTLMVAFFRRHLLGETAMEDWLTGSRVPGEVTETLHAP